MSAWRLPSSPEMLAIKRSGGSTKVGAECPNQNALWRRTNVGRQGKLRLATLNHKRWVVEGGRHAAASSASPKRSRIEVSRHGDRADRASPGRPGPTNHVDAIRSSDVDSAPRAHRPNSVIASATDSAAAVGVEGDGRSPCHKSELSGSWPMPVTTGTGQAATARASSSSLKGHEVLKGPPPLHQQNYSRAPA